MEFHPLQNINRHCNLMCAKETAWAILAQPSRQGCFSTFNYPVSSPPERKRKVPNVDQIFQPSTSLRFLPYPRPSRISRTRHRVTFSSFVHSWEHQVLRLFLPDCSRRCQCVVHWLHSTTIVIKIAALIYLFQLPNHY